jgi:hypothetical protein
MRLADFAFFMRRCYKEFCQKVHPKARISFDEKEAVLKASFGTIERSLHFFQFSPAKLVYNSRYWEGRHKLT